MCASAQFRGTDDGKTVLEYWSYEVDPVTTMTREQFTQFIGGFLSAKLVSGMEAASKKIAAGTTLSLIPNHIGHTV